MAKEKEKEKLKLKAPKPTYTPINASLNAGYVPPTPKLKSNLVVSQQDIMPVQQTQASQQPLQVRGALAALQPAPMPKASELAPTYFNPIQQMENIQDRFAGSANPPTQTNQSIMRNPQVLPLPEIKSPVLKDTPVNPIGIPWKDVPVDYSAEYLQKRSNERLLKEAERLDALAAKNKADGKRTTAGMSKDDYISYTNLEQLRADANLSMTEKIARNLYTPGAGLSAIQAGYQGVGAIGSRLAPSLFSESAGIGSRIAAGALREAATSVPLSAGYTAATNPSASGKQMISDTLTGTILGAGLGATGPLLRKAISAIFKRNGVPEEAVGEVLALPAPRERGLGNANNAVTPDVMTGYTGPVGALPAPAMSGPTSGRIAQSVNPFRQQFEHLMQTAKQMQQEGRFTPGKEAEELESLWSQMAGREGVSLDELIQRAYQTKPSKLSSDLVQRAKSTQAAREVAGAPLPVKSTGDRLTSKQGVLGSPAPLTQRFIRAGGAPDDGVRAARSSQDVQRPRIDVTEESQGLRQTGDSRPVEGQVIKSRGALGPTKGLRANFRTQLNDGNFSSKLQQKIRNTDQTYDVARNADTVAAANENVKNLTKAEADFLANESAGAEHIATGYRLMQELDALGEHTRSINIADKLAKDLTKSGQTVQAASLLARLSPEGQLLNLARVAEKNGKQITEADKVKFQELAAVVQDGTGTGIRANRLDDILNKLERGEQVSTEELKTLGNLLDRASKYAKKDKTIKDKIPSEMKDSRKRDKIVSFFDEAEQAALARIAAKKNRLNSMPIGEIADHAIVVAAQIAKGTIKAATYAEDMVKMFGEEIRPYAADIFDSAQKMLNQSSKRISEGKINEANNIVNRVSGRKVPTSEKVMEKYISENPVNEKDIQKLRELSRQVNELSGEDALKADMAMQKILNSYEKSNLWDKVQAFRYIAMLLNTGTQSVNAISGPLMASTNAIADVFGTMLDVTLSKALKQPRTTTMYGTNPLAFMARWIKGLSIGGKAGFEGVSPSGIVGPNEIRGLTYKSLYNPLSIAERSLGAVAKGGDYAAYSAVQQSEMRKIAFLDAKNNGIKGKANIDKHIEKFLNDPPPEAVLQADRIGKNTTFQRSDTLGGNVANFLANPPGKARYLKPLIGAVFPFVRTPVNIASTAVTLSPGGIIKGLYQLASKSSDASRREVIRTLSLGLLGTGGMTPLGYYLSKVGIITGANDSGNKQVDAIREQAGGGKYRFNTSALSRYLRAMVAGKGQAAAENAAKYREGDSQFDYNKLQPLAFPLAIGAAINDREGQPVSNKIQGTLSDASGSLLGMSTLKGLQDTFQPQYGGTTGEKAVGILERVTTSFLKSFSPSALAQEARRQDPIVRKTSYNNGILEDTSAYFKSRTPGLSQSLQPNKTTLGQNRLNAEGITGQYMNPYNSNKAPYNEAATIIAQLIDATGDMKLAPAAPDKKVEGKDKSGNSVSLEIPPDRYTQYQEELGNDIISQIIAIPSNLSDTDKADKVRTIYKKTKEKHSNAIKKELGIRISR
ncbi:hypothetical protein BBD42_13175 [Paenibacillus sp. BIHB 4019]|uniref:Large polyvalent protein associated domain-containing protein n=1 Tax=Paenibacillus sp. BIHB 4019 TaxID=1870819 RepID=A0A1B2DHX1_9BACL|nr:hypothetical protein [Paenibacillus sp. BIHB 4019]ANY67320.1 hypothetical protein BBD42_13175 [Paenibacillus sp. BIHB 4019]